MFLRFWSPPPTQEKKNQYNSVVNFIKATLFFLFKNLWFCEFLNLRRKVFVKNMKEIDLKIHVLVELSCYSTLCKEVFGNKMNFTKMWILKFTSWKFSKNHIFCQIYKFTEKIK